MNKKALLKSLLASTGSFLLVIFFIWVFVTQIFKIQTTVEVIDVLKLAMEELLVLWAITVVAFYLMFTKENTDY